MQSLLANNAFCRPAGIQFTFFFDSSNSIQKIPNEYNIETLGKITLQFNENYTELNRD